jgi:hypothetical protein
MEKIDIKILFGESEVKQFEESDETKNLEDNIVRYSFDTENEKKAFLLGLEEALGWGDFIVINN